MLIRFFALLLSLWFVFQVAELGSSVVRSYNELPEVDYWETVPHLDGYTRFPPVVFWEQHYEHRVVFPELVIAADWLFLKGKEVLPLLSIALLDAGVWLLFLLTLRTSFAANDLASWCALLLSGIVMSWPGVAFVLAFPFSLQFVMFQFAATASLLALSRRRVGWSIIMAVIATFSSANGIFVWPVLVIIVLLMRLRMQELLKIAAVGAISVAIFFFDYRNLHNSHPELLFSNPEKVLGYFVSYLGMPLGAAGQTVALAAGCGSLLLFILLCYIGWRKHLTADTSFLVPAGVVLLSFATGFVISFSRIPIDRPFLAAVYTAPRYVNFGAYYWGALTLLTFVVFRAVGSTAQWRALVLIALLFMVTLGRSGDWIHSWMAQYARYQVATLAIVSGVDTDSAAQTLNSDPNLVKKSIPELLNRHLALFSSAGFKPLGTTIHDFPVTSELPPSAITSVAPVSGGFRIIGKFDPDFSRLVLANEVGAVIGFGGRINAGLPDELPHPPGHPDSYFLAFAGPSFDPSHPHLYATR